MIAPWNYPVQLTLVPMISAIAAGNAVIVKPSEISVNVSNLLAELIPKYLDSEAVGVVMVCCTLLSHNPSSWNYAVSSCSCLAHLNLCLHTGRGGTHTGCAEGAI